jgi:hypothetical protein
MRMIEKRDESHLVETDRVVLKGEVGEHDKTAEGDAQRQDVLHRRPVGPAAPQHTTFSAACLEQARDKVEASGEEVVEVVAEYHLGVNRPSCQQTTKPRNVTTKWKKVMVVAVRGV